MATAIGPSRKLLDDNAGVATKMTAFPATGPVIFIFRNIFIPGDGPC